MGYLKFILLFFLSLPVFSQVKVLKNVDGEVELSGNSCESLMKNYDAIKQWKQKNGEPIEGDQTCSCVQEECKITISKILPENVKKILGKSTLSYGPNCFNTALIDQGILKHRRIVSGDEIKFWAKSELCTERKSNEPLSPGDLVIISQGSDLPVHAFTYLSDDLVFSKASPDEASKYELESYSSMFEAYGVTQECRHVIGDPPSSTCKKYANAYKCKSIENFEQNNKTELLEILNGLEKIECETEKRLFTDTINFAEGKELLRISLKVFRMTIIENRANPKLSSKDKFYWDMAWYRFLSLERQIGFLE